MTEADPEQLARVRKLLASGEAQLIRSRANLSLSEVAGPCGVDTATVWRWEKMRRRPRGAAAIRYLRLLDSLQKVAS